MLEAAAAVAGMTRAIPPAVSLSRRALQRLRLFGTFDIRWIELGDELGFTAADVADLEAFLDERETRAVLSALALTLLTPESDVRKSSIETVEEFFLNCAKRWRASHTSRWHDRVNAVWDHLLRIYDRATPAGQDLAVAALEYEDFLRSHVGRRAAAESGDAGPTRYVERLAELCGNIGRVVSAIDIAARIKEFIAATPAPPIITYTNTEAPATFGDLYVGRTLVNKSTGLPDNGLRMGERGTPYRVVVHGAPGAGKSTYVRNLRQELSKDVDGQPTLLLTARSYFPGSKHQSIVDYLQGELRASSNIELSVSQLRDLLTLGLVVLIVDGLDEVTDINQRVEMVNRIASFATEYPAVPLLVTSRSIGYERAPLPPSVFDTLVLDEYSDEQMTEYIQRWFAYIGRADLTGDFENESSTVADLRRNPLLLSLLCILYRERGSIPRRRRDIYANCADLLFHKWDSHRHINQPEELHANGERIMQELARWVYKSQTAQNGLPESVIKKTIGGHLRDTVGVEDGEARRRAGEFLEFCAERAWLLGTTGTDHGERLFGFTHRTFFEYFAAEAFARTSGDPEKIAEILIEAHKRDATTVLPELLLQAIDDKIERGAANTFARVCEQTDDEVLIMRLMEGVPLPTPTRAKGFDRILQLWWEKHEIPEPSIHAFLGLNKDARDHFIRGYLGSDNLLARSLFTGAWASLELAGETGPYAPLWGEAVSQLDPYTPVPGTWYEEAVAIWQWWTGVSPTPPGAHATFYVDGASGTCIGSLWLALERACAAGRHDAALSLDGLFAKTVATARGRTLVDGRTAKWFTSLALDRSDIQGLPDGRTLEGDALWAFVYAMGIIYESTVTDPEELAVLQDALPPLARDHWIARAAAARADKTVEVPRSLDYVPRWLRDWAIGKRSFTALR